KINVTRPNLKEREDIFKLYLSRVDYNKETVDISILARKTVWFTPAEIESMVREASLLSQRNHHAQIEKDDIGEAYERVTFGQKSNVIQPEKDKLWTAYHEAGHAIIYYLLAAQHDVMKATIIPRRGALGYVFARPKEELFQETKEEYLTDIKIALASYVVENKKFGTTASGVGGGSRSDFGQALSTAHHMVWSLGMGPSGLIGDFSSTMWSWGHWSSNTPISEEMKTKLDNDVQLILQECLKQTKEIIDRHWEAVDYFAQQLYVKEELDYDEIEAIFNSRFHLQRLINDRSIPAELAQQKQDFQKIVEQKKAEEKALRESLLAQQPVVKKKRWPWTKPDKIKS
ncbi:MAG TPA: hypothetical protein VLJ10_01015, partial [Candidatus Bathyarchaeia archaeon]|nr:hypothetical protein [Candidatus Bathyarchaeia archaeon]